MIRTPDLKCNVLFKLLFKASKSFCCCCCCYTTQFKNGMQEGCVILVPVYIYYIIYIIIYIILYISINSEHPAIPVEYILTINILVYR